MDPPQGADVTRDNRKFDYDSPKRKYLDSLSKVSLNKTLFFNMQLFDNDNNILCRLLEMDLRPRTLLGKGTRHNKILHH